LDPICKNKLTEFSHNWPGRQALLFNSHQGKFLATSHPHDSPPHLISSTSSTSSARFWRAEGGDQKQYFWSSALPTNWPGSDREINHIGSHNLRTTLGNTPQMADIPTLLRRGLGKTHSEVSNLTDKDVQISSLQW